MSVVDQKLLDLQWERSSCRSKKSSHESEKAANKAKIDRLELVKTEITLAKSDAEGLSDKFKVTTSDFDLETNWTGEKKFDVGVCMDSFVCKEYLTYIERIDEVLDSICDEITSLENENLEKTRIIGWLASRINSLANSIEKYFN